MLMTAVVMTCAVTKRDTPESQVFDKFHKLN